MPPGQKDKEQCRDRTDDTQMPMIKQSKSDGLPLSQSLVDGRVFSIQNIQRTKWMLSEMIRLIIICSTSLPSQSRQAERLEASSHPYCPSAHGSTILSEGISSKRARPPESTLSGNTLSPITSLRSSEWLNFLTLVVFARAYIQGASATFVRLP